MAINKVLQSLSNVIGLFSNRAREETEMVADAAEQQTVTRELGHTSPKAKLTKLNCLNIVLAALFILLAIACLALILLVVFDKNILSCASMLNLAISSLSVIMVISLVATGMSLYIVKQSKELSLLNN